MVHYKTSNAFQVRKLDFHRYDSSLVKSQREDFHDMFSAETLKREKDGDLSVVFCLTYNDLHIRNKYGQNLVDSDDLQVYAKSSAWHKWLCRNVGYSFDFVSVGEFGNGGKSHSGFSKRGKGQNPHFHCVGWFHKFYGYDDSYVNFLLRRKLFGENSHETWVTRSTYDLLCLFLRLGWQNNLVDCIEDYASDRLLQTCGLGFVSLDGKIKYSVRAGSYISKYIGKDMRGLQMSSYHTSFNQSLYSVLCDSVRESFSTRFDDNFKFYQANIPAIVSVYFHSPFAFRRYSSNTWYRPFLDFCRKQVSVFGRDFSSHLQFFDGWFAEIVESFCYQFNEDMNGRYSPKLRKFRGFGYSLLDTANLENGTYTFENKRGQMVTRLLPPSLARHAYYRFERYPNPDVTAKSKYLVRYYLNTQGRLHISRTSDIVYQRNFFVARRLLGDEKRAEMAAIVKTFLSTWNPTSELYKSYRLHDLLTQFDVAKSFWLAAHQYISIAPDTEHRVFVDILVRIREQYPDVYADFVALDRERLRMRNDKNEKDSEYVASWLKLYDSEDAHNSTY